jgi:hypothetical protein
MHFCRKIFAFTRKMNYLYPRISKIKHSKYTDDIIAVFLAVINAIHFARKLKSLHPKSDNHSK